MKEAVSSIFIGHSWRGARGSSLIFIAISSHFPSQRALCGWAKSAVPGLIATLKRMGLFRFGLCPDSLTCYFQLLWNCIRNQSLLWKARLWGQAPTVWRGKEGEREWKQVLHCKWKSSFFLAHCAHGRLTRHCSAASLRMGFSFQKIE